MNHQLSPEARQAVEATFTALSDQDYDALLESLEYRSYSDGQLLARQGEVGYEAYLILHGEVEVCMEREGTRRILGTPRAGEIVGEMAVLEQRPRVADMQAKGRVSVLVFDRERFLRLLAGRPELGMTLIKVLSVRMRSTLDQYMEDLLEKVRQLEAANADLAAANKVLQREMDEQSRKLQQAQAFLAQLDAAEN